MSTSRVFAPASVMGGLALLASSAFSAALAYDDVPDAIYAPAPVVVTGPVYGYAPVRPGVRVYGYGPVYRADPEPLPRRDRQPLGIYAPNDGENLSPPRAFFRGVERAAGD